jgi:methylthioribose-1-phosphate isomerase
MSSLQGEPKGSPSAFKPPYQTIRWRASKFSVLDQRQLPLKKTYMELPDIKTACLAIKTLAVRGAPLIGIVAAFAVAHAARKHATHKKLLQAIDQLSQTRPTAVNLFVCLNHMREIVEQDGSPVQIVRQALDILEIEETRSYAMAAHGQKLIAKEMKVGTYCNTGALAAPGLGTALGILIKAHLSGKKIEVVVPETRPLLQGARLTAWELSQYKIPYRLVTESALAGIVGELDAVFVGADRIAANGDTANKVGTFGLAIFCRQFGVPFYVVAPTSTIDSNLSEGSQIPIEERSPDEVLSFGSCRTAPAKSKVYNPAFDVTPSDFITAIVTEKGIARPPYNWTGEK